MKTASIRDLHIRTSELVRNAADGDVIIIERHGEAVAELRPLAKNRTRTPLPDMAEVWARMPKVPGDTGRYLEEER
jgi:prevent-host-death family protein